MANEKTGADAIIDALMKAPPEQLREILSRAGVTPTTAGMAPADLQTIMATFEAVSSTSVRETLRQERKENPSYPERSVFFPKGKFDDQGNALPPKVQFSMTTVFNKIRLGGELETEEEIGLFNRLAAGDAKTARDGRWSAEVVGTGSRKHLEVNTPSFTVDDRMDLPPLTFILRELLDGPDVVNPNTMAKRIAELEAQVKQLAGSKAKAA